MVCAAVLWAAHGREPSLLPQLASAFHQDWQELSVIGKIWDWS